MDLVAIAKVTKPHGVGGGLRVLPYPGLKDLLSRSRRLWLVKAEKVESFSVERVQGRGRFLVLKLQDVNDTAAAERFRGWEVAMPPEDLPALPAGQYYTSQLVGLIVCTEDGEVVGEIREVWPMPAHDVYRVMGDKGEVLIPAVQEIVREIDLKRGKVTIRPPEGLIE